MAHKIDKNKGGTRYANRQIGLTTQDKNPGRDIGAPNYEFYELEPAEVVDVILGEDHPDFESYADIGKAKIRYIHSEMGKDASLLSWARPVDANIKSYPLKHEMVIAVEWFGTLFYTQRLSIYNNPNQNTKRPMTKAKAPMRKEPTIMHYNILLLFLGNNLLLHF